MNAKGLNGIHVDLINVGALFPVDFDADKVFVHDLRDVDILE
jgi:hypothetical protein